MRFWFCLLMASLSSQLYGQNHTLSGYVRDAATGEVLVGAAVLEEGSSRGVTTNKFGFYSLTLRQDSATILFSYVGYKSYISRFYHRIDTTFSISLVSSGLLEEVIVEGELAEGLQYTGASSVTLPTEQIKAAPAFGGETDLLKVLQLLPGVQRGTEGTSGILVRGGAADQNLILLDNVPLYNVSHMYGFFSVFNVDAINHVELIKGGFPARYGGRLSSVVDITMKEGNQHKLSGQAGVSLIAAKLMFEGPLIKDRSSFLVTARRSYLNLLKSGYFRLPQENPDGNYYFYDINAKVNHRINQRNKLYLSFFRGVDNTFRSRDEQFTDPARDVELHQQSEASLFWANILGAVRWNRIFGPRLFSNFTGSFNEYRLINRDSRTYTTTHLTSGTVESQYYAYRYQSSIRDYSVKADFEFIPSPKHNIRFGQSWIFHDFSPGIVARESSESAPSDDAPTNSIFANELAGYIEDDWQVLDMLTINGGLHASSFFVSDASYASLQPRVSARFSLDADWSVKASYCTMQQYVHLLTNFGIGLPTDLWVPATDKVRPQFSRQAAMGLTKLWKGGYEASVEGYYKKMNNLIEYKDGASFLNATDDWQDKVESGIGEAYGVECFLQRRTGKLNGWVSYTLSWSNRQFDNINEGEWFPYRYDRRHDAKVVGLYSFSDKLSAGATWVYSTGNAVTVYQIQFDNARSAPLYLSPLYSYNSRNAFRMGNYHRLDVNADYIVTGRTVSHKFNVSIYNVYSRQNPFYLEVASDQGRPVLKQVSMFPILPSAGYTLIF